MGVPEGQELAETFAQIARDLQTETTPEQTWARIVEAAVHTVPGCDHAGISLVHRHGRIDTTAASDDNLAQLLAQSCARLHIRNGSPLPLEAHGADETSTCGDTISRHFPRRERLAWRAESEQALIHDVERDVTHQPLEDLVANVCAYLEAHH